MILKDIIAYVEDIAPTNLKEDFDNVGLMVGSDKDNIKNILVALDCTKNVIEEAKVLGVDLILTHHPLIFRKPNAITDDTLLGSKIIELIKANINVYSAHTNLDSSRNGINHRIAKVLEYETCEIMSKCSDDKECGIGRFLELKKELSLEDIINIFKKKLSIKNLRYVGKLKGKIRKVAIINGSGQDFFEKAKNLGAELIITGDTTYHFVSDYNEMGIKIIDLGHFNSEWPIFTEIMKDLEVNIKSKNQDINFYYSKTSKDPYNFI
ncbi:MAG: Nif3-like dinuclear metal center hexameric protein [Clostridium perfringens]|nr:Nif3-like dinuclear metal center hexameric protein [Clostridium perfringens]